MNHDVFKRYESNVQSYARSFPGTFERAIGAELWDTKGRRYIDFLSGCGSLNYGHNHPVLKEVLVDYISSDAITHGLDLHTVAKHDFLETINNTLLAPRKLDYVVQFPGPTGTNAVEAAFKLARKVTGRSKILAFTNGFHGVSLGALAATGNDHHRQAAGLTLSGAVSLPYDAYFGDLVNTADYLDRLLTDPSSGLDLPAAIIVETVQGEGGLNTASDSWLQQLQHICEKHDVLFIVDDIQAGCGRTGTFFSFDHCGIEPDIVTLSKSLSGYGLPLSLVLLRRELDTWEPGEHNGTFRGNNPAFVTATAALRHFWQDPEFVQSITVKSAQLTLWLDRMSDLYSGGISKTRGRGFFRGLVCKDPSLASQITATAFEQGLIIERSGPFDEVIKLMMPLTIDAALMQEGLQILERAMEKTFGSSAVLPSLPGNPQTKTEEHAAAANA